MGSDFLNVQYSWRQSLDKNFVLLKYGIIHPLYSKWNPLFRGLFGECKLGDPNFLLSQDHLTASLFLQSGLNLVWVHKRLLLIGLTTTVYQPGSYYVPMSTIWLNLYKYL